MKNFRQCQIEQTWVEGCNTKLRGFKLRSFEVGSPGKLKLCFKYVIKSNPQYVAAWSKKSESPKLISPGFRITSTLKKPSTVRYGLHPLARTSGTAASSLPAPILPFFLTEPEWISSDLGCLWCPQSLRTCPWPCLWRDWSGGKLHCGGSHLGSKCWWHPPR